MAEPRQPEKAKGSKSGVEPGVTSNTEAPRKSDGPVKEADIFGGAERTDKRDVKSGGKP